MRTRLSAALVVAIVGWQSLAGAQDQFSRSNYYLQACKSFVSDPLKAVVTGQQGVCLGAVRTLMDASRLFAPDLRFCVPAGTTLEAGVQILVSAMEAQPQRLNEPFVGLALEALGKAWPCKAAQ